MVMRSIGADIGHAKLAARAALPLACPPAVAGATSDSVRDRTASIPWASPELSNEKPIFHCDHHRVSRERAADEVIIKGPNGLSIACSQFSKQPDGNWRSSKDATLSYPDRPGSFGDNSFGPHGFKIGDVDIAAFLDEKCGK
jgi:hypothetical protein